jgi:hypothetical protein
LDAEGGSECAPITNFLLGEAARLLRRKPYQLHYALAAGLVEEPRLRLGGKRVFQVEDLERLAAHFGVDLNAENSRLGRG